jgi:hypothetical protein
MDYSQIRTKRAVARVLDAYGSGSNRNDKLRESLKDILKKKNLEDLYNNRKLYIQEDCSP